MFRFLCRDHLFLSRRNWNSNPANREECFLTERISQCRRIDIGRLWRGDAGFCRLFSVGPLLFINSQSFGNRFVNALDIAASLQVEDYINMAKGFLLMEESVFGNLANYIARYYKPFNDVSSMCESPLPAP